MKAYADSSKINDDKYLSDLAMELAGREHDSGSLEMYLPLNEYDNDTEKRFKEKFAGKIDDILKNYKKHFPFSRVYKNSFRWDYLLTRGMIGAMGLLSGQGIAKVLGYTGDFVREAVPSMPAYVIDKIIPAAMGLAAMEMLVIIVLYTGRGLNRDLLKAAKDRINVYYRSPESSQ